MSTENNTPAMDALVRERIEGMELEWKRDGDESWKLRIPGDHGANVFWSIHSDYRFEVFFGGAAFYPSDGGFETLAAAKSAAQSALADLFADAMGGGE